MATGRTAHLILADGTVFTGRSFGSTATGHGEVVFNTSMSGYQEILTDPSYSAQIVVMTYPEIGNVGFNRADIESKKIYLSGFVVRELSPIVSNYRAKGSLDAYLKAHRIPAIEGIDTRALVRHIREAGAMPALITSTKAPIAALKKKAASLETMEGQDLAKLASCRRPYRWTRGSEGFWLQPALLSGQEDQTVSRLRSPEWSRRQRVVRTFWFPREFSRPHSSLFYLRSESSAVPSL